MQMNIIEKIAQIVIARLDGKNLKRRLPYYEELVERGIGGFILFGGEKKEIKYAIKALQMGSTLMAVPCSLLHWPSHEQLTGKREKTFCS
jgi:hypothetical protein